MRRHVFISVTALAVFILSTGTGRAEVNFRPDSLKLVRVGTDGNGDPLFDVTPTVELVGGGDLPEEPVPVDYELFVAGVSVFLSEGMHNTEWTLCDQTQLPDNCPPACAVKITHGTTSVTNAGLCEKFPAVDPEFCFCNAKMALWPAEKVRIRRGEKCRLVVDPFNIVDEFDETDNELVIPGSEHIIPTVSEWGLVVLTLLGMAVGTIMIARKRRTAAA